MTALYHSAELPALAVALLAVYWLAWLASRRTPAEIRSRPDRGHDHWDVRRSS
jgi:hypothetical protein